MSHPASSFRALALAGLLALAGCSSAADDNAADTDSTTGTDPTAVAADGSTTDPIDTDDDTVDDEHDHGDDAEHDHGEADLPSSGDLLGDYTLADDTFGTMTTVRVTDGVRTIQTNALPDHETGEFPNSGNPNAISAQDLTWTFPAEPDLTDAPTEVRVTGVAVNGVKFEPGTAETASCASGETYRIEGLQDTFALGMDENNAHVQPTGEYHYHGIADVLVDRRAGDDDLVLVGFAVDGHLIYHSRSEAYASSYQLETDTRSGTDCTVSGPDGLGIDLEGTAPDGTYDLDWVFVDGSGDLDECNGTEIDGTYAYLVTDAYPYIGRCVMGDVSGVDGVGGAGPGAAPATNDAAPGTGTPPDAPDLSEAAAALGVTEQELIDALGRPPSVENAAAALGISVDELVAVLPPPPG